MDDRSARAHGHPLHEGADEGLGLGNVALPQELAHVTYVGGHRL